jgi:hypothetical protein
VGEVIHQTATKHQGGDMINLNKDFYRKLDSDKIKIKWNKNPIKMDLFLSFILVGIVKSKNHLGHCTGWTLYENHEIKLYITGGIVQGQEYLDNIKYGVKLQNIYNNFVNPFYLFELLTDEGKNFFTDYYKDDIQILIEKQKDKIKILEDKIKQEKNIYDDYIEEKDLLFYEK